jgi:hypothetical protein
MIKVSIAIRILFLQTCFVSFTAPGVAQQHHHPGGEGVPSEALLKLGAVHFPVSCSASVQAPFERGVAMLHSFWYEEARKQFASVPQADPLCAMAQWGLCGPSRKRRWSTGRGGLVLPTASEGHR